MEVLKRCYSISEMAMAIGVSTATLRRWDEKGYLKASRTPTNRRYYTSDQVAEFAPNSQVLSIGQAAKYLGLTVDQLQYLDKIKKLPAMRTNTGRRRYRTSDLDMYRRQNLL